MDEKEKRRQARKQAQQRKATQTFFLLVLAISLVSVYIIYRVLGGTGPVGRDSALAPNPYSPEDFATEGDYVTCLAGPVRRGIDVSEHQDQIDWNAVRDAGFDFAIIRIGYRGYSIGQIQADERARENLDGAREAGLDVGVYFYAQAISIQEAAEEADWCLRFLEGEHLDLPVVYDWEWAGPGTRTETMDRDTVTACFQTFCAAIERGGYQPMIYFNNHVSRDLLDLQALAQYPFWLAQYREQLDFPYQVEFWQYTERGSVPGIKGNVDIDLMFLYQ